MKSKTFPFPQHYCYHRELLTALEIGDSNKAKKIMYEHMCVAEKLMLKQEAMVSTKLKEFG